MNPDSEKINAGIYEYTWNGTQPIHMRIDRIRETRSGITGEVSIKVKTKTIFGVSRTGLLSQRNRAEIVLGCKTKLFELYGEATDTNLKEFPWLDAIDSAFNRTLEIYRSGDPILEVGNDPLEIPKYAAYPFVAKGMPNMIYGAGGSLKSYMGILICCILQSGEAMCDIEPLEQQNCLVLDYESNPAISNYRIRQIKKGMGLPDDMKILYRHSYQSLPSEIDQIQEIIREYEIGFLLIDSYSMSCGGKSDDQDIARAYFMALRSLNVTTLILDHISKQKDSDQGPIGSVYKYNQSRCVWLIKAHQGEGSKMAEVGLFHTKYNHGPKIKPKGFKFEFFEESTGLFIDTMSLKDSVVLADSMSVEEQIANVLVGTTMKPKDIADETGISVNTVRTTLKRGVKRNKFVKLVDGHYGIAAKDEQGE